MAPRLSVVLPTYRRPDLLRRCLAALAGQSADAASFEVVVVDDASGAATTDVLRAAAPSMPNLRWMSQPTNAGQGAARNRALRAAAAPLVLFVDDDIVAAPDLVETHLRLHRDAPTTHAVVGHVDWLPSLPRTPFMRWLDSTDLQFAYQTWLRAGPVAQPSRAFYTSNLSVRREFVLSVGGFDERLRMYDDIELGIRLEGAGLTLDYRPEALAWHARPITRRDFVRKMTLAARGAVLLDELHPDAGYDPTGMLAARRSTVTRSMLRAVAPIAPRMLGKDLRSAWYWAEVAHGWERGLAQVSAG